MARGLSVTFASTESEIGINSGEWLFSMPDLRHDGLQGRSTTFFLWSFGTFLMRPLHE
jgi:hypothetical protein